MSSTCQPLATTSRHPPRRLPRANAVRLGAQGEVTHLTAINALWLLDRDGELVATLRDGRRLRLQRDDLADVIR